MIEVNPFALRELDNFMFKEMIEWVTFRKENDEFEKVGQQINLGKLKLVLLFREMD